MDTSVPQEAEAVPVPTGEEVVPTGEEAVPAVEEEAPEDVQVPLGFHIFPALYLNLGVEMMYVLDQRLRVQKDRLAQSVEDREKSDKALKQIILGFLSKKTLEEVFRGYATPTRAGLKKFFERIAHCSYMRLSENSMDKLYDLMIMAYKYALQKITMPEQIMTVTVNHLRAILDLIPLDREIGAAVENAFNTANNFYGPMDANSWYMIRNALLVFFQDTRVKVSMFVRDHEQSSNGSFIVFKKDAPVQLMRGGEPVGVTKYFGKLGEITFSTEFPSFYAFVPYEDLPDSLDASRRSTDLGANKYQSLDSLKIQGGGIGKSDKKMKEGNEMALFENLMNSTTKTKVDESQVWAMSLFDDDQEEKTYLKESAASQNVTIIDASKKKKSLKTAMDDLKLDKRPPTAAAGEKKKKTKGASVLDLMDEAAARPATAKPKAKRSESTGTPTKPRTRSGSRPATNASERASSAAPKRAASAKRRTAA